MNTNNQTAEVNKCRNCGKVASATVRLKRCTACKAVTYCSVNCQKQDWSGHKGECRTLVSYDRALANAKRRGPNDPFWMSFIHQASVENVKKLYHDEIGIWKVTLDEHNNNLVVKDVIEEVVLGHGPCPEKSEDLLKVIYACMILPEVDNRPRRPDTIFLGMELEEHYKYLWSEMLYIPLPIYMDNEEGKSENRKRITWPKRRLGKYAEGETFYEPQLKLRIEWLDKEQREEVFGYRDEGTPLEYADVQLDFWRYDMKNKKPRWAWDYESWESCVEDLEAFGNNSEERRSYWQTEIFQWENAYKSLEDLCMDLFGAKSVEEAAMDHAGVPRLHTNDEGADKLLERAGWECQGYKPFRCFVLTDKSVKLGKRLLHYQGFYWEEKNTPQEYPW